MNDFTDRFVVAKNNLLLPDGASLEESDIGILMKSSSDTLTVFFVRVWEKVQIDKDEVEYFEVNKTGDAYPKKICNICHKLLETSKFAKNQNGKNNRSVRRPSCNECRKILEGMSVKPKTRREWLLSKPERVPFECPVCGKRTIAGITSKVVLDHNHLSGEPRAWICDSCNTGIGRFKDDVALLQGAVKYLG